jgi:Lrp/AsnC family transcriptional regulator, leucine-responsive regulatory protein
MKKSIEKSTPMDLDNIDAKLLNLLQADASLSNQALCQQTHISPATGLRRIKRLRDLGLIERQVAILSPDRLALAQGHGITAVVEVSLDRQSAESLDEFERSLSQERAVQQCYRVASGPDFVLILYAHDLPQYQQLSQRLFNNASNVRNVKSYFSLKRSKFSPVIPVTAATIDAFC